METQRAVRFPLMFAGMLCLLTGIAAGLLRLDLNLFLVSPRLATIHGPLMVSGFLGTVIGLERAVALGRPWGYLAPLFSAIGGILFLAGAPGNIGAISFILSGAIMTAIYAVIIGHQPEMFNITMATGAVAWMVGNVFLLMDYPVSSFVLWWGGFVILTIAGERLELSRFIQPPPKARIFFMAILGTLLAGMVLASTNPPKGAVLCGAGMTALAAWLFVYDIPRRTVRQTGLTRFVAVSLLLGYFWLLVSGLLLAIGQDWPNGPYYDATLHSLFLGFAFSMIFGHAPIIFPAVLKLDVPFSGAFYIHLAILHISLVVRVAANLLDLQTAHVWGGALNALALATFLLNTVTAIIRGKAKPA
jgi:hypothetical protein